MPRIALAFSCGMEVRPRVRLKLSSERELLNPKDSSTVCLRFILHSKVRETTSTECSPFPVRCRKILNETHCMVYRTGLQYRYNLCQAWENCDVKKKNETRKTSVHFMESEWE